MAFKISGINTPINFPFSSASSRLVDNKIEKKKNSRNDNLNDQPSTALLSGSIRRNLFLASARYFAETLVIFSGLCGIYIGKRVELQYDPPTPVLSFTVQ